MKDSRSRSWYSAWSSERLYSAHSTIALNMTTASLGLRPALDFRAAAGLRQTASNRPRKLSQGTSVLIPTSGSFLASRPA